MVCGETSFEDYDELDALLDDAEEKIKRLRKKN